MNLKIHHNKGRIPWNKGKKASPETCLKCSLAKMGKSPSPETRRKISEANRGKVNSPAARLKISLALKGKPLSLQNRKNLSLSLMGKTAGEKNGNWAGGKTTVSGYVRVLSSGHPYAKKNGRVLEHRLIAEKALGRYLKPSEKIHHVNGVKDDNRTCNLVICQDQAYHRLLHTRAKLRSIKTQESGQSRVEHSIDAWPINTGMPVILDPFKEMA